MSQSSSNIHQNKTANRLVSAASPYLLQHAYNPVDWYEWSEEALAKAKQEDKPIIVSIGYSSCHWCHVMERESFENEGIASMMNKHFVCIKVDREERPDIDQIYMEAVQAMGTHGGWPLNVFLTPEQKPFYGGTYFPPQAWMRLLSNIERVFRDNRQEIETSAEEIRHHITRNDVERFKDNATKTALSNFLDETFTKLQSKFDTKWGGMDKAPKFVMPSVWQYLLRHYHLTENNESLGQVLLTLNRVARGGIYDQVGGGFARYSVDGYWHVPHFEKMLYDNAQLLSLYTEAYQLTKEDEYKSVIEETFGWLQREMTHPEGGFYSALDADSEGVEGKFYTWKSDEVDERLKADADLVKAYYAVTDEGNWEHGNSILKRDQSDESFLNAHHLQKDQWILTLRRAKKNLLAAREQRVRPGLDDKIVTAWNAMTIVGLTDAYRALGTDALLGAAEKNFLFLTSTLWIDGRLRRSFKSHPSAVGGFLDDYAYMIQAAIKLYEVTFQESYVHRATELMHYTLTNFSDDTDGYFFYTDADAEPLIARKKEIFDNVIPSSNAIMARNLYQLGIIMDNEKWKKRASAMTFSLSKLINMEPNYMSYWAIVQSELQRGMAEVVIRGEQADSLRKELSGYFSPFAIFMGGASQAQTLPLVKNKVPPVGSSSFYICSNRTCLQPVSSAIEAYEQIRKMVPQPIE